MGLHSTKEGCDLVRSRFLVGLIGVFLFFLVVSCVSAASSDEAQAAISRAEPKMSLAYKSVLEAEEAGADVSNLLFKLNNGSTLLSQARMQYRIGNFSEAVNLANQCFDSLNGIEIEAKKLRDSAVTERKRRMLISAVGSAFSIGVIVFASILGWRFFKDKYCQRVLKMKPEVQANDSR